ncbi:MAG: 50S ribosomal protein L21 [Parcubacteria group bacterium]
MKFAIIAACGRQYRVSEGQIVTMEKLETKMGGAISFGEVLLIADGDKVIVGTPTVAGKTVTAKVIGEGRSKKVRVVKFKSKVRYKKVHGHRQYFTRVKIEKIPTV